MDVIIVNGSSSVVFVSALQLLNCMCLVSSELRGCVLSAFSPPHVIFFFFLLLYRPLLVRILHEMKTFLVKLGSLNLPDHFHCNS